MNIQAHASLPTEFGDFTIYALSDFAQDWRPELVLVSRNTHFDQVVNVRIHSECITGEVFRSKKCECGPQLDAAMQYFGENGGILIYLRQEGRNIGIINKIKAYALQEQGHDTVQANLELGLPVDGRDFEVVTEILTHFGVKKVRLFTNNPEKLAIFENHNTIELVERVPLQIPSLPENEAYLATKKNYFKHWID